MYIAQHGINSNSNRGDLRSIGIEVIHIDIHTLELHFKKRVRSMGLRVPINMKQQYLTALNYHCLLGIPSFSEYSMLKNFASYFHGKLYATTCHTK